MATVLEETSQLAQLCAVCTYLVNRIDEALKQLSDPAWTKWIFYAHPYTTTRWLSSAEDGCAICIRLLDSAKIQRGRVKGLTSSLTHEVIEGAEMLVSCSISGAPANEAHKGRLVTFRATSKNQTSLAEAAAQVYGCRRIEIKRSKLDISTGGRTSLLFAKTWIQDCIRTHPQCVPSPGNRIPTRLIHIRNGVCRLYTSPPGSDQTCPLYATLSHCWGKINMFKLTKDNIDILCKEIPIEKLTKTFKEALVVTKALGLEYIWIDSLCIIQDDIDDWDKESLLMADVYGNAVVNIAATNAPDGTFGLFVERDRCKSERQNFRTSGGIIYEIMDNDLTQRCLVETPLSRRAWAFQERYLAQRTLHFTAEQIFAECRHHIACEAWPEGVPESIWVPQNLTHFPERNGLDGWSRTIYHYLEGQLTYSKDIFVALSGVARHFQERLQDQYVAGLWMKQLPWQLCWRPMTSNRESYRKTTASPYRAPSWSWASTYGPITWRLFSTLDITSDKRWKPVTEIAGVELIPVGRDSLGQLRGARLRLKCGAMINSGAFQSLVLNGKNTPAALNNRDNPSHYWRGLITYDQGEPPHEVTNTSYLLPLLQHHASIYKEENFLFLNKDEIYLAGLIVAPSPGSIRGEFVRIGAFDITLDPFNTFKELSQFFSAQADVVMDESQYEENLGPDADGIAKYAVTLI